MGKFILYWLSKDKMYFILHFKGLSMNLLEKRFTLALAKDWWVVLLRGVIGILFGITLFAMPMMSALVLMIMFAFVLIFDGILGIYMESDVLVMGFDNSWLFNIQCI